MHPHLSQVFSRLDEARASLHSALDRIPASLRRQRPATDRWSAAEVIEHLTIVERAFTGRVVGAIEAARAAGLGTEAGPREPLPAAVTARMADRVNTRSAPEAFKPTGTIESRESWAQLEQGHRRLQVSVAAADGLALNTVTADHHAFGTLSVYQWIELMAAHETRHVGQLDDIAAALANHGQQ